MRYDANNTRGLIDAVYHAEQMRFLNNVAWVDDVTNQYAQYAYPATSIETDVHQAKKIEMAWPQRIVIINPIEGAEDGETETTEAVSREDEAHTA